MEWEIHARLLASAVMVITSSTFILGYLGVTMVNSLVSERFDQQINYMAEQLAMNAELGILIDEHSLLEGLARSVLNERDVAGVQIENSEGQAPGRADNGLWMARFFLLKRMWF